MASVRKLTAPPLFRTKMRSPKHEYESIAMTQWRPPQHVKVKAIGLHWRDGKLLAAEVYDDHGQLKGVRPLGGGVEFGEPWQTALRREFKEELDVEIEVLGAPHVMENIYTHHGAVGHEVLCIGKVRFSKEAFAGQNVIEFFEDSGAPCTAKWFDLSELDLPQGPALFPSGLKQLLADTVE